VSPEFVLQARSLASLSGIRHAFFTRLGGVSGGVYASLNGGLGSKDESAHVAENRARMAAALGVARDNLITAYQIHSPTVVIAERPWNASARQHADALVTRVPGLAVAITTADCGPILFADERAGVVAAAHAGWRGALSGVADRTVEAMEKCGADRARVVAALGPMIRQANYEVGPEFVAQFKTTAEPSEQFFRPSTRAGHALFDLAGFIARGLAVAGVQRIEDIGHCTYADSNSFFSYRRSVHRREGDYGRHINAIALSE
jgi:hypothetical protein